MTILATSPNGQLRLRKMRNGKGVVELKSRWEPDTWTWCVWRSCELARAWELFNSQLCWHQVENQPLNAFARFERIEGKERGMIFVTDETGEKTLDFACESESKEWVANAVQDRLREMRQQAA